MQFQSIRFTNYFGSTIFMQWQNDIWLVDILVQIVCRIVIDHQMSELSSSLFSDVLYLLIFT